MSMTVEDIRANKKLQSESALNGTWCEGKALLIHALWTIAEVLAEIRDVMRFEAGVEIDRVKPRDRAAKPSQKRKGIGDSPPRRGRGRST